MKTSQHVWQLFTKFSCFWCYMCDLCVTTHDIAQHKQYFGHVKQKKMGSKNPIVSFTQTVFGWCISCMKCQKPPKIKLKSIQSAVNSKEEIGFWHTQPRKGFCVKKGGLNNFSNFFQRYSNWLSLKKNLCNRRTLEVWGIMIAVPWCVHFFSNDDLKKNAKIESTDFYSDVWQPSIFVFVLFQFFMFLPLAGTFLFEISICCCCFKVSLYYPLHQSQEPTCAHLAFLHEAGSQWTRTCIHGHPISQEKSINAFEIKGRARTGHFNNHEGFLLRGSGDLYYLQDFHFISVVIIIMKVALLWTFWSPQPGRLICVVP